MDIFVLYNRLLTKCLSQYARWI